MTEMKKGFTLIELVMVVAILAIVSTLAVTKIGNLRESSARSVSIANQAAVGRAVETFLSANAVAPNRLDRLDGLLDYKGRGTADAGTSGFAFTLTSADWLYTGPDTLGTSFAADENQGLLPGLRNVLCLYALSAAEKAALRNLGLGLVMRHFTDAAQAPAAVYPDGGEDGVLLSGELVGRDPEASACMPVPLTNANIRLVAAITPRTVAGREIYREMGYDVRNTRESESYTDAQYQAEIASAGGPLVAFGLGAYASIVGSLEGGLESVPHCTFPPTRYYRRYILLFRLKTTGNHVTAVFAGVLDPCGNTMAAARRLAAGK